MLQNNIYGESHRLGQSFLTFDSSRYISICRRSAPWETSREGIKMFIIII